MAGADAASIVMGTLSQRGTIHPPAASSSSGAATMGAIGAIMLVVGGGEGDALAGIQNITIIMAAPFGLVMVLMCVALARDLRSDPWSGAGCGRPRPSSRPSIRRAGLRRLLLRAGEAASHPRPVSVETHAEHERHSAHHAGADGNGTAHPVDVPAQRGGAPEK